MLFSNGSKKKEMGLCKKNIEKSRGITTPPTQGVRLFPCSADSSLVTRDYSLRATPREALNSGMSYQPHCAARRLTWVPSPDTLQAPPGRLRSPPTAPDSAPVNRLVSGLPG